jgi:hypothetical protein
MGSRILRASSRVAVGEELHRALQVREQHSDLLALAFKGSPGGKDPLGEVFGSVSLGGGRRTCGGTASGYGLAAFETEPGTARQFCAAGAAGQCEAGSAAETEPGMGRILLLTPRAFHAHSHAPGAAQVWRR